ncbi:Gfo/Idh/MocA family protein [Ekhidna sp.]
MRKKIKWGILGPGIIAHEFAQDFKHVSNAEITAVASRSAERAKDFAEQYGIPCFHEGYEDLYADDNVDAIYVATPHNFHIEQVKRSLKAGKSVLCEKPITISQTECEELINLSNNTGQYLIEGMWTYFLPAIKKAQEWIDQGRIGKILHLKSSFGYPVPYDPKGRQYDPELAGGSLLDMGVYTVAMASKFLGDSPSHIYPIQQFAESKVDKDTLVTLEYEDRFAHLHSSFQCKLNNHTYIIGEDGYIDIPDFWRARECYLYKVEEVVEHYKDDRKGNGFEFEIEDVSNQIIAGQSKPTIVTHETSLAFQKIMDAIVAQAKKC